MVDVKSKRKAIILVASGIDTFSKINLARSGGSFRKPVFRSTSSAPEICFVRSIAIISTRRE
jgi:hypothetical protein